MTANSLLAVLLVAAASPVAVPADTAARPSPQLDGRIGTAEWAGAAEIRLGQGHRLLLRSDRENLYLAVAYQSPAAPSVDVYLRRPGGGLIDLHASAKVGQRLATEGAWSDYVWGEAPDWTSHANARDPETRRYKLAEGREFRISRSMLPTGSIAISVVVSDTDREVWPAGASETDASTWALVDLS